MNVATCLLLYSAVVAVFAPPILVRVAHAGDAPRLGIATWCAAIGTVLAAWIVSAGFLLAELVRAADRPWTVVIGSCMSWLADIVAGRAGVALQVALLTLAVAAFSAFSLTLLRLGRRALRMRQSTHEHAQAARIIGRRVAGVDAVVVDSDARAAYCSPGRPDAIVITSAAVAALNDHQLAAVLAHERAHLAGRHPQLLGLLRGLASVMPRMTLFTTGAAEVARLIEMRADDSAARTHGPNALLGGLLALTGPSSVPTGSTAAADIAVLARAERLAAPASPLQRARAHVLLATAITVTALTPLATGALLTSGLAFCGPLA